MMTKYKIIVSDPWDFEDATGSNLIIGEIVKVLSPSLVIFKSDHLLSFGGQTGKILILKPRYEKQALTIENNYEGTVGGAVFLLDDFENNDENFLEDNSKYVLIGSLEKVITTPPIK
ncbi:hypothetical protein [Dyadobacter sp. LHD-138]|uniref:hypothetical protein n=1 Tax=Dyadobacter sp. LHD-138 TaxID=3071413 RepID=UPI0027E15415|nr:hypothetical protein [Dyadobacter sp. LHD-138]MDQ6482527.1 hypothetical protein [Dyadobacter sp. LHD-138]